MASLRVTKPITVLYLFWWLSLLSLGEIPLCAEGQHTACARINVTHLSSGSLGSRQLSPVAWESCIIKDNGDHGGPIWDGECYRLSCYIYTTSVGGTAKAQGMAAALNSKLQRKPNILSWLYTQIHPIPECTLSLKLIVLSPPLHWRAGWTGVQASTL